ncbi:Kae1-associated serine/threonine protein kinase [Candidatus Bathyarchaeota archaeon]|nr:Kae1-associated serine/threonine protein kinase [Candidatus Bathyarchaeota archaeon]
MSEETFPAKKPLHRGAEADLYLLMWYGLKVVQKVRVPKSYRVAELDMVLRRTRTRHEAMIMHDAKKAGVTTPLIYLVDVVNTSIVMQYVQGPRLKEYLETSKPEDRIKICRTLGDKVGRLHAYGIVHGDLTTSNMIVTEGSEITLIDFGLSEHSHEIEKQGVDILLGQRVFNSTHYGYGAVCYKAFLEGYRDRVGSEVADQIDERVKQIAHRGRYAIER